MKVNNGKKTERKWEKKKCEQQVQHCQRRWKLWRLWWCRYEGQRQRHTHTANSHVKTINFELLLFVPAAAAVFFSGSLPSRQGMTLRPMAVIISNWSGSGSRKLGMSNIILFLLFLPICVLFLPNADVAASASMLYCKFT